MHLHVGPETPLLIRAAAESALVLHIAAGCTALVAGAGAFAFRKGGRLHRLAGTAFVGAMGVLLVIGAIVAPMLPQLANTFGAIFALYIVASGWQTVRRRDGGVGRVEKALVFVPLAVIPILIGYGWIGLQSPDQMVDGVPFMAPFIMSGVAAFAAALDLKVIFGGGIAGAQRIVRHVWRMGLALVMAAGSFYPGQAEVIPPAIRQTHILYTPVLSFLALLIFWLVRVQFTGAFRPHSRASAPRAPLTAS